VEAPGRGSASDTTKVATASDDREDAAGKGVVSREIEEAGPVTQSDGYTVGTGVDASKRAKEVQRSNEGICRRSGEKGDGASGCPSLLGELITDIDFTFEGDDEQTYETENLE
jgi:hypothetical protein